MIRYDFPGPSLRELIEAHKPGWLARAARKTAVFKAQGAYKEEGSIWSEVKAVYMRHQGESKCAYCERKLESIEYGKGEQAVEHFRPKGAVKAWKPSRVLQALGLPLTKVRPKSGGYYLLPYHPFNYGAACIPCNSALKSDRFPIAGTYRLTGTDPAKMGREKAYLIYPLGSIDDDPEKLIEFEGASPRAVARSGHKRNRALVTIEFFGLDDPAKRKNLFRERAVLIVALFPQLQKAAGADSKNTRARKIVDAFQRNTAPHANCLRSFTRLFAKDPAKAHALYDAASELIASSS